MAAEYSFRTEGDRVIVTEKWRLDDPEKPFVVISPPPGATWHSEDYPMTMAEFRERFGTA